MTIIVVTDSFGLKVCLFYSEGNRNWIRFVSLLSSICMWFNNIKKKELEKMQVLPGLEPGSQNSKS